MPWFQNKQPPMF